MNYEHWGHRELVEELERRDTIANRPEHPFAELAAIEGEIIELLDIAVSDGLDFMTSSDLSGRIGAIVLSAYQLGQRSNS